MTTETKDERRQLLFAAAHRQRYPKALLGDEECIEAGEEAWREFCSTADGEMVDRAVQALKRIIARRSRSN